MERAEMDSTTAQQHQNREQGTVKVEGAKELEVGEIEAMSENSGENRTPPAANSL
jgi:hypothetical protein